MARNPWDEQDPFGTYQEPVNPMTILEYLKAVGDAGQGVAGGLVRAPHVMAKGIDDIVDMFKGQDTSKDSASIYFPIRSCYCTVHFIIFFMKTIVGFRFSYF